MNNKEFITELAQRGGYTQDFAQKLTQALIEAMGKSFEKSEPVTWPGFGTFEVKKRMERTMINPTGLRMLVPPKLVLNFRPVASLKEKLKNGGEADA